MTLGQALAAKARLIAWYKLCAWRTEPDVMARRRDDGYRLGQAAAVPDCGARDADFVVSGAER